MKPYELHKIKRGDIVFFFKGTHSFRRRPLLIMQDWSPLFQSIYAYKITSKIKKKIKKIKKKLLVELPKKRIVGLWKNSIIDCRKSNLVKLSKRDLLRGARKLDELPNDLMQQVENAIGNSDLDEEEIVAIHPKFFEPST